MAIVPKRVGHGPTRACTRLQQLGAAWNKEMATIVFAAWLANPSASGSKPKGAGRFGKWSKRRNIFSKLILPT